MELTFKTFKITEQNFVHLQCRNGKSNLAETGTLTKKKFIQVHCYTFKVKIGRLYSTFSQYFLCTSL